MNIEILAVSNLLLWLAVIALGAGYLGVLRQLRRPGTSPAMEVADIVGRHLDEVAPALSKWQDGTQPIGFLFLSADCAPCITLGSQLGELNAAAVRLVVIGDIEIENGVVLNREMEPRLVARLRQHLVVRETPFLWVARDGELIAGGVVNTPADVESLALAGLQS